MSFSMAVRSKPTHGPLRRRRTGAARQHQAAEAQAQEQSSASAQTTSARYPAAVQRNLRQGGASQDRALYSCNCGYAFDAPVSTSVDCPHCGDRQAW